MGSTVVVGLRADVAWVLAPELRGGGVVTIDDLPSQGVLGAWTIAAAEVGVPI